MTDSDTPLNRQGRLLMFFDDYDRDQATPAEERLRPEEKEIAEVLLQILEEDDLPPFATIEITSTTNESAKSKLFALRSYPELQGHLYPEALNNQDLDVSKEVLEKAPWVNNIHAWMKILNAMNTIGWIQHQEKFDPRLLLAAARELFRNTTNYHGLTYLRGDRELKQGLPFYETIMREAGTKGVNPGRYVTKDEMLIQLQIFRSAFQKGRRPEVAQSDGM